MPQACANRNSNDSANNHANNYLYRDMRANVFVVCIADIEAILGSSL